MSDEKNETKPQPLSEIDKARLRYYVKGANFFSNMNAIIIIGFIIALLGGFIYFGVRR